jgi:hypothetical protein
MPPNQGSSPLAHTPLHYPVQSIAFRHPIPITKYLVKVLCRFPLMRSQRERVRHLNDNKGKSRIRWLREGRLLPRAHSTKEVDRFPRATSYHPRLDRDFEHGESDVGYIEPMDLLDECSRLTEWYVAQVLLIFRIQISHRSPNVLCCDLKVLIVRC